MIDSHCHLSDKKYESDLDEVIERANKAGVDKMICIADSFEEGEKCLKIAAKYEQIYCTLGCHPHNAKSWKDGDEDRLIKMINSSPKAKAVGEIGLDYYYDHSPREVQKDVFRVQLELAKKLNLPAVVHCREAIADLKKIIFEVNLPLLVVHCCTERWEDMAELAERGYFLSFTGIATYPKSHEIRRTIKMCPIDQLMIETDAPYLAPVPNRGQRNEPAFVVAVARCVAEMKGISLEEADEVTTKNTGSFFGI